jgi:hypothetical protein
MDKIEKTFRNIKEGDKVYRIRIANSKLVEDENGGFIELLKVEKRQQWNNFYTLRLTFDDRTHAEVNMNAISISVDKKPQTNVDAPIGIFTEFYSPSRKKVLEAALTRLKSKQQQLSELRRETLILINQGIISAGKIEPLYESAYDDSKENAMSEVEFAEMAL